MASASNFNLSPTAIFLSLIFHFALLQLWQTELQIDWARYELEEGWVMGAARQISTWAAVKTYNAWIDLCAHSNCLSYDEIIGIILDTHHNLSKLLNWKKCVKLRPTHLDIRVSQPLRIESFPYENALH